MNELIEKLKDKNYVRAFGLMEETLPGSRECFKKVGKKNCLCFHGGLWGGPNNSNDCFNYQFTYAINPDYKPEPEFVDLEITESAINYLLGVERTDISEFLPYNFNHLHLLPSLPNFELFWYKDTNTIRINFDEVAHRRHEGKTVFARFRSI